MGHLARMGENRIAFREATSKPRGKRPVERPRLGCAENVNSAERGLEVADEWMRLAGYGFFTAVMGSRAHTIE